MKLLRRAGHEDVLITDISDEYLISINDMIREFATTMISDSFKYASHLHHDHVTFQDMLYSIKKNMSKFIDVDKLKEA